MCIVLQKRENQLFGSGLNDEGFMMALTSEQVQKFSYGVKHVQNNSHTGRLVRIVSYGFASSSRREWVVSGFPSLNRERP